MREDDMHCVHGTYIGGPCGPDYLCGWCEDGISEQEYNAIMRARADQRRRYNEAYAALVDVAVPTYLTCKGRDPEGAVHWLGDIAAGCRDLAR